MQEQALDQSSAGDALAFILSTPDLPYEAVPEQRPGSTPRAPRFVVHLPLRYRLPGSEGWYHGETENISQSGVAFWTDQSDNNFVMALPSDDVIPVEMVLEVPQGSDQRRVPLLCRGVVVRASRGLQWGTRTRVAVRLRGQFEVDAAPPPSPN